MEFDITILYYLRKNANFLRIVIIIMKYSYYEKKGDNNVIFKHCREQTVGAHQNPLHKSISPPQWTRKSAMYISCSCVAATTRRIIHESKRRGRRDIMIAPR